MGRYVNVQVIDGVSMVCGHIHRSSIPDGILRFPETGDCLVLSIKVNATVHEDVSQNSTTSPKQGISYPLP